MFLAIAVPRRFTGVIAKPLPCVSLATGAEGPLAATDGWQRDAAAALRRAAPWRHAL